ncbi:MAG: hypothetical protein GF393_11365 [Armatimonadia bacterium]|nr:hypothetical protein [Armatimonadia bacterium]
MRRMGWLMLVVVAVAAVVVAGCDGDGNGNGGPITGTFDAAAWDGTWDGQWLNQTFNSTGDASFEITVDEVAQTLAIVADMDGAVFGQADPPPINLNLQYTDAGANGNMAGTPLGDLAFTIDANDNIQGRFTNIPNAAIDEVTFTGQRNGNTITLNYTVQFAGGGNPATGTVTVNLQ